MLMSWPKEIRARFYRGISITMKARQSEHLTKLVIGYGYTNHASGRGSQENCPDLDKVLAR